MLTKKEKQKKLLDTFGLKLGDKVLLNGITYEIAESVYEYYLYSSRYVADIYVLITENWKKVTPILDDAEKKYLSQIIRPFREKVEYIVKASASDLSDENIYIGLKNGDFGVLPYFNRGAMYKAMKTNKKYRPEELGI